MLCVSIMYCKGCGKGGLCSFREVFGCGLRVCYCSDGSLPQGLGNFSQLLGMVGEDSYRVTGKLGVVCRARRLSRGWREGNAM